MLDRDIKQVRKEKKQINYEIIKEDLLLIHRSSVLYSNKRESVLEQLFKEYGKEHILYAVKKLLANGAYKNSYSLNHIRMLAES